MFFFCSNDHRKAELLDADFIFKDCYDAGLGEGVELSVVVIKISVLVRACGFTNGKLIQGAFPNCSHSGGQFHLIIIISRSLTPEPLEISKSGLMGDIF